MTLRSMIWICALGLSILGCQRFTPTPLPLPTPTPVVSETPFPIEDVSEVGHTDGIVILATVILALIVLTALIRHQAWLREENEEEEE